LWGEKRIRWGEKSSEFLTWKLKSKVRKKKNRVRGVVAGDFGGKVFKQSKGVFLLPKSQMKTATYIKGKLRRLNRKRASSLRSEVMIEE